MANLVVVYDADKEMAAVVDTDERRSWGPAMVGPDAGDMLQTWIGAMPFDVTILDGRVAAQLFTEWLADMVKGATETPGEAPDGSLESMGSGSLDEALRAEAEASQAGAEPPEPGPADTDVEANEGTPATVIVCPLCNGAKQVQVGDPPEWRECDMCHAVGVVKMGGD